MVLRNSGTFSHQGSGAHPPTMNTSAFSQLQSCPPPSAHCQVPHPPSSPFLHTSHQVPGPQFTCFHHFHLDFCLGPKISFIATLSLLNSRGVLCLPTSHSISHVHTISLFSHVTRAKPQDGCSSMPSPKGVYCLTFHPVPWLLELPAVLIRCLADPYSWYLPLLYLECALTP